MLSIRIQLWYFRILLRTIPHYLTLMLFVFIEQITRWKSLLLGSSKVTRVRVYDLLNAGPRSRFVVGLTKPMIVHNCSYGAGPNKVHQTLLLSGVDITLDEVKRMHTEYWALFGDVKKYESSLLTQAEKNGGWFLNGLGFPACICQDKQKDILNRQIQGTGHTILTFLQKQIADSLAEEGIPYRPYVFDFHDEIILEVPDSYADRTYTIMQEGFVKLNELLKCPETIVKFKGSGGVLYSLAEAKIEDYKSFWRNK